MGMILIEVLQGSTRFSRVLPGSVLRFDWVPFDWVPFDWVPFDRVRFENPNPAEPKNPEPCRTRT
jgi:hypothetical protein